MRSKSFLAVLLMASLTGCAFFGKGRPGPVMEEGLAVSAIRAEAVVEITEEMPVKGRAVIIARRPGSFRIEVKGPFLRDILLLVSNGGTITVFSRGEERQYSPDDPLSSVPFTAGELVTVLLGGNAGGGPADTPEPGERVVNFMGRRGPVRVSFSDFRTINGALIPFSITIKDSRRRLRINYTRVEINPEFHGEFFTPKGLR